jgi:hypothetical protein
VLKYNLGAWFMRVPTDLLSRPHIWEEASATDWRVFLSICRHQGWKVGPNYRKTFALAVDRTAEEARCSRRAALRSIAWWCQMGALKVTKRRRMNVYEIVSAVPVSPGNGASPRHKTPRDPKRGDIGRYVPSAVTGKVPAGGTCKVPAHGTPNQKSYSEVSSENPLPSPRGGNGHSSEASARPSLSISEGTLREILKVKSREEVLIMLRQGNYPIPEWLLIGDAEDGNAFEVPLTERRSA